MRPSLIARSSNGRTNARLAFWVAPNMEFFEYLPESRPTQPDIPFYARMDYGNRVGFWRMLDVLNKHKVRACCCLSLELLDHSLCAQFSDGPTTPASHSSSSSTSSIGIGRCRKAPRWR